MVKVDLITGFLGAGKTTFIHKYLHYLKAKGEQIHLIENEFGKTSVDSLYLQNEIDASCSISDLSGMCMCCIGKSAFIRILVESAKTGCDRIVVEPSGIYDVDEFFDVMSDARVSQLCEIGTILTIFDPLSIGQLTSEASYLLFCQLLASGTIVFSKTQLVSEDVIEKAKLWIGDLLEEKGCQRDLLTDFSLKPWDELTEDDFEEFEESFYYRRVHDSESFVHDEIFQSEELVIEVEDKNDLEEKVMNYFNSDIYGNVFRVKGYANTRIDGSFEVNCTGDFIALEKVEVQSLGEMRIVIIGQRLKHKSFR